MFSVLNEVKYKGTENRDVEVLRRRGLNTGGSKRHTHQNCNQRSLKTMNLVTFDNYNKRFIALF